MLSKVIIFLQNISEITGKLISWLTLGIVLITFAIVVLRYLFNYGSIAMQESVSYMYALVFLVGAAYTLKHDNHVRVDILYQKFNPKIQAWIDFFGHLLLLLPMMGFIFWINWDYVLASWSMKEESGDAGGLPYVYLLKTGILLMSVLLMIEGTAQMLKSIQIIKSNKG